ncbi:hypothetical protein M433DRAFT_61516 [Acidomyces richmondensis BFW]|nr:MAG: hypothetical protein FE78DRAFT_138267 [Acidomyces sp. 'richmondensis']KYG48232.1 hypothetical protein M433DRAFT_61516 [Acidomyces richmondensis BFW]
MGVTGLWQIVQPCARPIKIETLNRKRLAVDASIWIYQFLKAVRDKEGNALRNSHIVGFFRRICKLLFIGIKPVFVFDGGAPALKRQTITARKRRREGRREDAARTAGKLLAVQMQRRAEEEERKRADGPAREMTEVPDDGLVYVEELQMTAQERQQNRKFRKKDAYHLPELEVSMSEMGGPNDPRVMSLEELQAYARQFDTGEDINVYDFSKIDYDSPFFMSLPASDRYNILNAARLRSRLRMGHSKEQLDAMFPDRMAFSKFQIDRVKERNELTTRLMNINDGDTIFTAGLSGPTRVASEKAREYVLVKNDGVEGGWALGVLGGDEGTKQDKAIDVDQPAPTVTGDESSEDDDEGFEDVPIEGLNRLPKRRKLDMDTNDSLTKQREALYKSRRLGIQGHAGVPGLGDNPDSLFVADGRTTFDKEERKNMNKPSERFREDLSDQDDEDLRRAIAMSLNQNFSPTRVDPNEGAQSSLDVDKDEVRNFLHQQAADADKPVPPGSARAIASILNKRANNTTHDSRERASLGTCVPRADESESDDETVDFQAALMEVRQKKRKFSPPSPKRTPVRSSPKRGKKETGFDGPLPFERLDLGSSLLGKKKKKNRTEEAEAAGGFEHPASIEQQKRAEPLPPWFSGNLEDEMEKQRVIEREDRERAKEFNRRFMFQSKDAPTLKRNPTGEVIDLDDEVVRPDTNTENIVVDLETGDERSLAHAISMDTQVAMSGVVNSEPVKSADASSAKREARRVMNVPKDAPSVVNEDKAGKIEWGESENGDSGSAQTEKIQFPKTRTDDVHPLKRPQQLSHFDFDGGSSLEANMRSSRSVSPEFENVDIAARLLSSRPEVPPPELSDDIEEDEEKEEEEEEEEEGGSVRVRDSGTVQEEYILDDDDDFSDPEEAELLNALSLEAEEHARFASTLNNKTKVQNIADYENELKQLRNQQKKDRRDADEVTHIMITECQELLRLFGLPYVTAPMEAEAQCAELVRLGLVDGIVTDDSDCFLFGGTRIYKNMFNQAKFVECYLASDLEKEFDLTRDKLIQIAQLLGSDYTEGLPGVGPVTALEILSEFENLTEFKEWWNGVQMNTIPKEVDNDNIFRKKFRRNATKLFLPQTFPDPRVELAYQNPEVDNDPEAFQWGVPDLGALRQFLMATIGWSQDRTDEVLVPVIRDMNRRADEGTQANITAFFEGGVGVGAAGVHSKGEAFAPRKKVDGSKRMGKALGKMAERAKVKKNSNVVQNEDDQEQRVIVREVYHAERAGCESGTNSLGKVRKRKGKT